MNARMTVTWVCLYFVAALAQEPGPVECTSIGNSDQCVSDDNGVVLLQTNIKVTTLGSASDKGSLEPKRLSSNRGTTEIDLAVQGEARTLVNASANAYDSTQWFSRRRRRRWKLVSTITDAADATVDAANTVADAATDWANQVADWTNQAASAAETAIVKLVEEFEEAAVALFKALVPECLRDGAGILSCLGATAQEWIDTRVAAMEDGLNSLTSCFSSIGSDIMAMADMVSDIECTDSIDVSYPSGIDFDWPPGLEFSSKSICTNVGGIDTSVITAIFPTFETCAEDMVVAIARVIDPSVTFSPGCSCPDGTSFGIYVGVSASLAAGVSGSLTGGFVVGCDGCDFRFSPFWSWFVGVTSNVAAGVGGFIGYAVTWDSFWGQALVVGASGGPGVVALAVGLGFSLPSLSITTTSKTISTGDICIFDMCVALSVDIDFVPTGFDYTLPQLGTIDIGIEVGVGVLPVDVSAGYAECMAIDLVLSLSSDRRRRRRGDVSTIALTDNMKGATLSGCWVAENGYITGNDDCGACSAKTDKISWEMYCDSADTSAALQALVYAPSGGTDSFFVSTGSESDIAWSTGQGTTWFWAETSIAVMQGSQSLSFGYSECTSMQDINLPSQCRLVNLTDNLKAATLSGCWEAQGDYIASNGACSNVATWQRDMLMQQETDNISWPIYCDSAATASSFQALVYAPSYTTDSFYVSTGSETHIRWDTGTGTTWFWSERSGVAVTKGSQTFSLEYREATEIKDITFPFGCRLVNLTDNMKAATLSGCWEAQGDYIAGNSACSNMKTWQRDMLMQQETDKISWQIYCDSAATASSFQALVYAPNGTTDSFYVSTGSESDIRWDTGTGTTWFWAERSGVAVTKGSQTFSLGYREATEIKDITFPFGCSLE